MAFLCSLKVSDPHFHLWSDLHHQRSEDADNMWGRVVYLKENLWFYEVGKSQMWPHLSLIPEDLWLHQPA